MHWKITSDLGWPSGIDLGHESELLLKVSCSIISSTNLSG